MTLTLFFSSTDKSNSSVGEVIKLNSLAEISSNYKLAVQVRDPYERLLSAYRFVFEHSSSLKNSNRLNEKLIKKYSFLPTEKVKCFE